jgi:hypothetical protein
MNDKTEAKPEAGPVKFTYVGPEGSSDAFGYEFPRGEPVEVTDPAAIAKLKNNQNFTWPGRPKDAPPPPKAHKANQHKPARPSDGPRE